MSERRGRVRAIGSGVQIGGPLGLARKRPGGCNVEGKAPRTDPARIHSKARRFPTRLAGSGGFSPMQERIAYQGITFDDVLLEPGYSELLPRHVDTRTHLTAKIALNIPIL